MVELTEEQADEVEALEAIYPEEFSLLLTGDVPVYTIKLVPDPSAEPEENHVSVALVCRIPASYPDGDALPALTIEVLKGLSKRQADEVKEAAEECAAENVGMASVFTVAECVREWLADNNVAGQDGSMYADMMRRMNEKETTEKKAAAKKAIAVAADAEDGGDDGMDEVELERLRQRQAGVQVTEATFLEWQAKFEAEMAEERAKKMGAKEDVSGRVTGKGLFLAGKAGVADEDALLAAEMEAAAVEAAAEAAVAEARGEEEEEEDDGDNNDDDSDYGPDEEGEVEES